MSVVLYRPGEQHAMTMIRAGHYDMMAPWSFSAEDGNKLLGASGDDWQNYADWHMGQDTAATDKTKERWKYPFGKDGKVYRSAISAIRSRSSQQGEEEIFAAAGRCMDMMKSKEGMSLMGNIERRFIRPAELRIEKRDGGGSRIVGHAAVFDSLSEDLGGFREKIAPGAFAASIATDDVRALFNHNPDFVLGRTRAGTLKLAEDATGLAMSCDLPDTQAARDLAVSIERGDITQQSFGFETVSDDWQMMDGETVRTLKACRLWDVSPVTFPAYPQTDVAMRGLEAWRKTQTPPVKRLSQIALMRLRLDLATAE